MSRPPFVSEDADRLSSLSRRRFLVGTATAALVAKAAAADPLRAVEPDIGLIELEQTFRQALDAYEAARQHFNHCEDRYFDLRPRIPEALTEDGPLGHLLDGPCSHWRAADLRRMLKNPEHREVWDQARAALPLAMAYEAGVRRAKRASAVTAAEAAHNAAIDAIGDVGDLILAAPARSLEGLAVKARVIKTWGRPEWWDPVEGRADTYERLAAQVLDAVAAAAEAQRKRDAG